MATAPAKKPVVDDDMPPVDEPGGGEGEGLTVDLDSLPGAKKPAEERGAKKGGADREDEGEDVGALDVIAEEADGELQRRRREERRARKEARLDREQRTQQEIDALREEQARLRAQLQRGAAQGVREEIRKVEGEMQSLQRSYEDAKELKRQAYEKNDGKSVVDADEAMAAARERYSELSSYRTNVIRSAQEQEARPKVSATLQSEARAFTSEHKWYDTKGGDRDSAKLLAIDRGLAAEGWDPNTKGYWEELRERVREQIPHRFNDGGREIEHRDEPAPRQRTGGSGREGGADSPRGNTFYLSPARMKALKEAGMWEDPAKRAKMIRTYKARDEQEARQRRQRGG